MESNQGKYPVAYLPPHMWAHTDMHIYTTGKERDRQRKRDIHKISPFLCFSKSISEQQNLAAGPIYRDLGFPNSGLVFCGSVSSESHFLQPMPVFCLLYKEHTVLVPRGYLMSHEASALRHRAALRLWSGFPRGCGRSLCQHPRGSMMFFSRIYWFLLQRLPCVGGRFYGIWHTGEC